MFHLQKNRFGLFHARLVEESVSPSRASSLETFRQVLDSVFNGLSFASVAKKSSFKADRLVSLKLTGVGVSAHVGH
jgi:hypothetical protein